MYSAIVKTQVAYTRGDNTGKGVVVKTIEESRPFLQPEFLNGLVLTLFFKQIMVPNKKKGEKVSPVCLTSFSSSTDRNYCLPFPPHLNTFSDMFQTSGYKREKGHTYIDFFFAL